MTDLTFNGGNFGAQIGNQQFTMRNLVFNGCTTAISQFWDWGWVYQGISINNCQKGIDISAGGPTAQSVGSMIILDSSFTNTPVAVLDAYTSTSSPPTAGSLILENVSINNVGVVVSSQGNTVLGGSGGQSTIAAWGQGHKYVPNGPQQFQGSIAPVSRPSILAPGGKYYTRSKPQYNSLPVSSFVSARAGGAAGDGNTDDTAALQRVINSATAAGNVVFVDAGTYMLTSTLTIPPGAKIVGEGYSVFMSTGSFFNDPGNPQPVVRVGAACATGRVEWSDMLVSTRGQQRGAILIEWNLASDPANPSGIWDVHTRIGGTVGSNLQYAQCPSSSGVNQNCVAAYMSMHITKSAGGLYMENVWLWTADHDVDDQGLKQVSVYNGRGLLIESAVGGIWLFVPPFPSPRSSPKLSQVTIREPCQRRNLTDDHPPASAQQSSTTSSTNTNSPPPPTSTRASSRPRRPTTSPTHLLRLRSRLIPRCTTRISRRAVRGRAGIARARGA